MRVLTEDDRATHIATVADHLVAEYDTELQELLFTLDVNQHYAFPYNLLDLIDADAGLGDQAYRNPAEFLPVLDAALRQAQETYRDHHPLGAEMTVKPLAHVRLTGVPLSPGLLRTSIPGCDDMGPLIGLTGTVIRTGMVKVVETQKLYKCTKCKGTFMSHADIEQYYLVPKPVTCLAPNPEPCRGNKFVLADSASLNEVMLSGAGNLQDTGGGASTCTDYQEIKVQEQVNKLAIGSIPKSICVVLENDLVDQAKSGDDVTIVGTLIRRWRGAYEHERCDIELTLMANNVIVHNNQGSGVTVTEEVKQEFAAFWERYRLRPFVGRDHVLASFCAPVFGLYVVKLAVFLVLIGGVERTDPSGTRVRGETHLLLVGDPGTGKSQFLKYATKVVPRSVLTTGIGSSSAGLTVTAVKDGNEWSLEAGALVLADRGLCCIDEFNSIREQDKTSILEAMEQQSISIAKAGIVCKLNSRCTVLAATNPKGQFDPSQSLSVNLALASPLLSRFDLILILLDTPNDQWDRVVSSFILGSEGPVRATGGQPDPSVAVPAATGSGAHRPPSHCSPLATKTTTPAIGEPLWGLDKLQAYLQYIKATYQPELTPESRQILATYYQIQRQGDSQNAARTTVRLLESLIRLSQAHARLMARHHVNIQDAVIVILLMETSMQNSSLLEDTTVLHSTFPDDPEAAYLRQERVILNRLGLARLSTDTHMSQAFASAPPTQAYPDMD
ncbi:DNA helicase mcm9 [Tieghemiomyces parasiticus]|uniref:DNA helicase n=1 Tax=Tieghemiomyces parasiticus TaxID=78921 RepID=A0A9W8AL38_9FUNG|nr:DNA helicase mcm9 [Tieghemiomyces parasiticus]